MPAPSPSIPLGLLNPGEIFMNPTNAPGPGVGSNTLFSAAQAGALASAGYGATASGLSATGTVIGTAPLMAAQTNHFSTVATGTGAQLPLPATVPYPIAVFNSGAAALSVYPPTLSGTINNLASGAAFVQNTGTVTVFTWFGGNVYGHTP